MAHPIAPQMKRQAQSLAFAATFVLALMASPLTASPGAALAATPGPTPGPEATAEKGKAPPSDDMEFKELKERLRALGEAIRKAIENATRSFDRGQDDLARGKGGLGALAPKMSGRDLRAVYGPKGPTLRSVRALLAYRLVLLGNDRLTAGRVYERDKRIIAEIVTVREQALVTRYMINKQTGIWVPER
jgi:hypothetical protein